VDSYRWRVEFTVPETVDIQEWPHRDTSFAGDHGPNPLLERLRQALEADQRVRSTRVAPVIRGGDQKRQQLLVSAQIVSFDNDMGRQSVSEVISDVVGKVIPAATLVGAEQLFVWRVEGV
jgi:hypothetical protein